MSTDPKPRAPRDEKLGDAYRPPEPLKPGPSLWCSDCRAVLRAQYYAMNERPVCAACREPYRKSIERGTGPGATGRAVLWGLGAAIGGAILFGIVVSIAGFGRILMAIAVGYIVGKAISAANGGYPGRKYQILAAALTYFAIGLGNLGPVAREIARAADPAAVAAADASDAETAGAEEEEGEEEALDDEEELVGEGEEETATSAAHRPPPPEPPGFMGIAGALLVGLVTLPLVSGLAYGISGAVVTLLALGYGVFKAWELTAGGPELSLRGPYRVGTGPITHTV